MAQALKKNLAQDEVIVFAPELDMKEKVGFDVSIDQVLAEDVIAGAQKIIDDSHAELMRENRYELDILVKTVEGLIRGGNAQAGLRAIIVASFAIKSRAGMTGYSLATALAKSLHVFCESRPPQMTLNQRDLDVLNCHVQGIKLVFDKNIKGDGGGIGKTIVAELSKLIKPAAPVKY